MVSFAEPGRLWLLALPAAAFVLTLFRHRRRLAQQRRLASPAVWLRLMGGAPATGLVRMVLWSLAAAAVVLALARPQWGELPAEESIQTRDLVFALDVSDSMLCPDVRPSRLARSLEEIQRSLPRLEGNRVAVVVFAGDAYPLVPLTTDLEAVGTFLSGVDVGMVGLPGSNLERAVRAGLELLPEEGEGRMVVLFTDGENLQGNVDLAVDALKQAGVGIVGVVAGTEAGGPIPIKGQDGGLHYKTQSSGQPVVTRARRDVLDALAGPLDGRVLELSSGNAALELAETIDKVRTREIEERRRVHRIERFPLFLVAAAAFLVAGFAVSPWRRGLQVLVALVALTLGPAASVASAQAQAQGARPAEPQQVAGSAQGQARSASAAHPVRPGAGRSAGAGAGTAGAAVPPTAAGAAAAGAAAEAAGPEVLEPEDPSWWQRLIPGGSRRLARGGLSRWNDGKLEDAATRFYGAWKLDRENETREYDLGTALAATGRLEQAAPLLEHAHESGVGEAAFNLGTAALQQGQGQQAVQWLREALISSPKDEDVRRNYELALRLMEQQRQKDQQNDQDQNQEKNDQEKKDQDKDKDKQDKQGDSPTPTPQPQPAGASAQPTPTPTPSPESAIYAALERAEAQARKDLQTPTPQSTKVEKDW